MTTKNPLQPIFLDKYDFIGKLMAWSAAGPKEQERHWGLSLWKRELIQCCLTWRFDASGSTRLGAVNKCAATAEEATFLALEEFVKPTAAAEIPKLKGPKLGHSPLRNAFATWQPPE